MCLQFIFSLFFFSFIYIHIFSISFAISDSINMLIVLIICRVISLACCFMYVLFTMCCRRYIFLFIFMWMVKVENKMRKNDNKSTVQLFLISISMLLLLLVPPNLTFFFFFRSYSDTGDWLPSFFSSSVLFSLFHIQFLCSLLFSFIASVTSERKTHSFLFFFSSFLNLLFSFFFLFLIPPFIKNVYMYIHSLKAREIEAWDFYHDFHHFIYLSFFSRFSSFFKQQGSKSFFFWRYIQWWEEK